MIGCLLFNNPLKNTEFLICMVLASLYETRCVCETQMPPIMANSKDGKGHKDIQIS